MHIFIVLVSGDPSDGVNLIFLTPIDNLRAPRSQCKIFVISNFYRSLKHDKLGRIVCKLLFVLRFSISSFDDKLIICLSILLLPSYVERKEDIGGRKITIEIFINSRMVKSNLSILSSWLRAHKAISHGFSVEEFNQWVLNTSLMLFRVFSSLLLDIICTIFLLTKINVVLWADQYTPARQCLAPVYYHILLIYRSLV